MFASAVEVVKTFAANARRRDTPDAADTGHVTVDVGERPMTFTCPICASAMAVRETTRIDDTGDSDFALHAMQCDSCGMVLDRLFHPAIGYEPGVPI